MSQQPTSQSQETFLDALQLLDLDSGDALSELLEELLPQLREISPPRLPYELERFVVGAKETPEQQSAICHLEEGEKLFALLQARVSMRKIRRRIEYLEARGRGDVPDVAKKRREDAIDDAELEKIGLLRVSLAAEGALHELKWLDAIRRKIGSFTLEERIASEPERWKRQSINQTSADIAATGRISVGNQEMLRLMGLPLHHERDYVAEVEKRFLEVGQTKILVAVPTLKTRQEVEKDGLACLHGWSVPTMIQQRFYVITGRSVADAYTDAVFTAQDDGAEFILCVEDDHIIPAGTFEKIWSLWEKEGPRAIVGAWYPMKKEPRTGAPIIVSGGRRRHLDDDGGVHEVYVIPQGFTLIPTAIFRELPQPWFKTTDGLTQDGFFSQIARQAGWKLLVDTSARIEHVCRETGKRYGSVPRIERVDGPCVLHAGCGSVPLPAGIADGMREIRLDANPESNPDIVASITSIPLEDGTVDCVFSSHLIEHLHAHEVPKALSEFFRVLKRGGTCDIRCPDLQAVAQMISDDKLNEFAYISPAGPITPRQMVFGHEASIAAGNEFMCHKTGFTKTSLRQALGNAGFSQIEVNRGENFELRAVARK